MDNLLEFYAILYQIVRGWPQSTHSTGAPLRYERLNSFAVIDSEEEQFSNNFGKDARYKPDQSSQQFYSRWWESNNYKDEELKVEYPALTVWEEPGALKNMLNTQNKEQVTLRFCFMEQFVAKYESGAYDIERGQQRSMEEIKAGLRKLRNQFFQELGKWVLVREASLTAGGTANMWVNKDHLTTLVPGTISSFKNKVKISSVLHAKDTEQAIIAVPNTNGLVHAYASAMITLNPCQEVSINHAPPTFAEKLDHPANSSA